MYRPRYILAFFYSLYAEMRCRRDPADTRCWPVIGSLLGQRHRRWETLNQLWANICMHHARKLSSCLIVLVYVVLEDVNYHVAKSQVNIYIL